MTQFIQKSMKKSADLEKMYSQKVLLAILPFWTPLIPPLGITSIKSYVMEHGFHNVKVIDANMEMKFRDLYYQYFNILKKVIPEEERGNFYSVGNEVWQNHMMAYLNYKDEGEYKELVAELIMTIFFKQVDDDVIEALNDVITKNYEVLEAYIVDLMEKEQPKVFALGVYIGTLPASIFSYKLIKKRYPSIKTVMGGGVFYDQLALGTKNLEEFLEKTKDYIDTLLIGEGELLFLKYLKGELPDNQRVVSTKDIGGESLDLNEKRIPDFSDLPIHEYPYISVYCSRSCPYRCTFCSDSVYWGKYRSKKPRQIVEEWMILYEKYHFQLFYLSDLLLNPIISELSNELIEANVSLYWDGFIRVSDEVCNPETVLLWRRAGLYRLGIGNESGSQNMLDLMKKGITLKQSKASISNLANMGIKTTTFWLIGYPGETEKDFQMTLDFLEEMKDDIYYAEGNVFWSILDGRPKTKEWLNQGNPLYPERFKEMLMLENWMMDTIPTRKERYLRMVRFVNHCKKLGIQNRYSWDGIFKADERWKRLHENSVPSLVEFKSNHKINENLHVKKVQSIDKLFVHDGNWGF